MYPNHEILLRVVCDSSAASFHITGPKAFLLVTLCLLAFLALQVWVVAAIFKTRVPAPSKRSFGESLEAAHR
jgi:hypothetical protein